ncbi:MAG: hypothetical protein CMP33_04605 [Rickettsiales bacterium]|nr:hypothetical protein [Rickettsiales bacterium]|tara:strand:+ start:70405 stop:70758 length:354 start_codon:yes stop_codon:yes gene_type:complete
MKMLGAILLFFTIVAVATDVRGQEEQVEWQDKPIICTRLDKIEEGLSERGERLLFEGIQSTTVRDAVGLSSIPINLPISIYVNPKTKTYTIIEYHPSYETYCIISYGSGWRLIGDRT